MTGLVAIDSYTNLLIDYTQGGSGKYNTIVSSSIFHPHWWLVYSRTIFQSCEYKEAEILGVEMSVRTVCLLFSVPVFRNFTTRK